MTIFSSLHYHHPPSPSSPHPIHSISNPFTPTTHQTTTIIHPSSPTLTLIHIHPVARSIRSSPPPPTPSSARRSPIEPPPQLGCLRSSSGLPVSPGLPNSLPGRTIDSSLGSHPLQREFQPFPSHPSHSVHHRFLSSFDRIKDPSVLPQPLPSKPSSESIRFNRSGYSST